LQAPRARTDIAIHPNSPASPIASAKSEKTYPPPCGPGAQWPCASRLSARVDETRGSAAGGAAVALLRVQPSGRGGAPSGSLRRSREGRKTGRLPSGSPVVCRSRPTAPKTPSAGERGASRFAVFSRGRSALPARGLTAGGRQTRRPGGRPAPCAARSLPSPLGGTAGAPRAGPLARSGRPVHCLARYADRL